MLTLELQKLPFWPFQHLWIFLFLGIFFAIFKCEFLQTSKFSEPPNGQNCHFWPSQVSKIWFHVKFECQQNHKIFTLCTLHLKFVFINVKQLVNFNPFVWALWVVCTLNGKSLELFKRFIKQIFIFINTSKGFTCHGLIDQCPIFKWRKQAIDFFSKLHNGYAFETMHLWP